MGANIPAAAANIPQSDGSSLMTTLNEQLRLKLDSTKTAATVVVIDSVDGTSRGLEACGGARRPPLHFAQSG
jgi:uncharacterized protein (TIGR03435 family)